MQPSIACTRLLVPGQRFSCICLRMLPLRLWRKASSACEVAWPAHESRTTATAFPTEGETLGACSNSCRPSQWHNRAVCALRNLCPLTVVCRGQATPVAFLLESGPGNLDATNCICPCERSCSNSPSPAWPMTPSMKPVPPKASVPNLFSYVQAITLRAPVMYVTILKDPWFTLHPGPPATYQKRSRISNSQRSGAPEGPILQRP